MRRPNGGGVGTINLQLLTLMKLSRHELGIEALLGFYLLLQGCKPVS